MGQTDEPGFFPGSTRVGLVGGLGGMGSLFERWFGERGFETLILDTAAECFEPRLLKTCDLVLLAVPMRSLDEVIPGVSGAMGPGGLLVDLSSVKVPSTALLEAHRQDGDFVAGHPMFGPSTERPQGQTFFICERPGRASEAVERYSDLMRSWGMRVHRMTPQRHDLLMSRVQVLRQALLLAASVSLGRLGFRVAEGGESLESMGSAFRGLLDLVLGQLCENRALWEDITRQNPYTHQAVDALEQGVSDVVKAYRDTGDRLRTLIEEATSAMRPSSV